MERVETRGEKLRRYRQALGPGLLMAGSAIGVSHLVQSTRAGSDYGLQLLAVAVLINVVKYPFFAIGHRYAAATGESLLHGYRRMGPAWLWIFLPLNLVSAIISIAAVTFVTAGLAANMIGSGASTTVWSAVLMATSYGLVVWGRYGWLNGSMKLMMLLLTVTTVVACGVAWWHGPVAPAGFGGPSAWSAAALPFLVALMGWMPAPIELSVWQSLWVGEHDRHAGERTRRDASAFDFNFGYILTLGLAGVFVLMGYFVLYGSGVAFSNSSAGFAAQLVAMYKTTLGDWVGPVVSVAAFTAMFSTTLTVIDAYPRSLAIGFRLALPRLGGSDAGWHAAWVLVGCIAGLGIIAGFLDRLKTLVDLATSIAFLAAPVFAYMNLRLITSEATPVEWRPGRLFRGWAWAGLVFLAGFGLIFLAV